LNREKPAKENALKTFLMGLSSLGLGVLFAPESGKSTRSKVRERFTGLAEDLAPQIKKATDRVKETAAAYSEGADRNN
jgi:gas vesicle protein